MVILLTAWPRDELIPWNVETNPKVRGAQSSFAPYPTTRKCNQAEVTNGAGTVITNIPVRILASLEQLFLLFRKFVNGSLSNVSFFTTLSQLVERAVALAFELHGFESAKLSRRVR